MNLGEVMIGQEEMHLIGELCFEFGGAVENLPTVLSAVGVEMFAVDQFLENNMPLRVVGQISGANQLIKVPAMIVDIAGDPDFAAGFDIDDLLGAEGAIEILIRRRAEGFYDGI